MHLFLAIDLPSFVKNNIESQLSSLKDLYPQFRWVASEDYHITIHFIGEITKEETIKKIKERFRHILYDKECFYLYATTVDVFSAQNITIYLNFRREKKLKAIVDHIRKDREGKGGRKRKFITHLTIARYRLPSKQQYFVLKKRLEHFSIDVEFLVKEIFLYESNLSHQKPIYRMVETYTLVE